MLQFLQTVGDVNDAAPLIAQLVDDDEQVVDLLGRQRRSRLVHDQDARVCRKRLGDFNHLLLGNSQIADDRLRVDLDVHAAEHSRGLLVHLLG